jgi:tripartite-type tricarboxylate transporter receptor subunit TctC
MAGTYLRVVGAIVMLAFGGLLVGQPAHGQSAVEDFYKKTTVTIISGYSSGGGFDTHARSVARFLGKHIPGSPSIVIQNMPGAGSLVAANHVYNIAAKDGSVIGFARGPIFEPMVGSPSANFDVTKFNWIGSGMVEFTTCALLNNPQIKSFEDMTKVPHTLASSGPGSDDDIVSRIMIKVLGTKSKIVTGYPAGNEMTLAVERGEVDGRCGWSWTSLKLLRPEWVTEKKIRVLVSISVDRHPDLPDVPSILELAKNDKHRQIIRLVTSVSTLGRPFALPPGAPADRVETLRKAFAETINDSGYVAEVLARKEPPTLTDGATTQALIAAMAATPKDVLAEAKAIISE